MAIDRVKKVWLISPTADAAQIPQQLARIGLMHVAEVPSDPEHHASALSRLSADTRDIESRIRKLSEALDILSPYAPTQADLIANFIPTPLETTRDELRQALEAIVVDHVHTQATELASRRDAARAAAERAQAQLHTLDAFRQLHVAVPAAGALRWTHAALWLAPTKQARRVLDRKLGPEHAILEELGALDRTTLVASACLCEEAEFTCQRLADLGFEPVAPPQSSTTLDAYVDAIEAEQRQGTEAAEAANADLAELATRRRQVELVLGHWERELDSARALDKMVATGRATALTGYVRVRELERFQAALARDMPHVSAVAEDPEPGDNIPVSLSGPAVLRPAQFLVSMYGLPDYFEFDPSAFLFASFLIFFGMCLGDAVYGLLVIAMALWLMRRFREYPGIRALFELLAYGGVSSFVVGVLTRAWASDLWKSQYLGEGNLLATISQKYIGDPLDKPMVVLAVALLMGIANQFWGITVKMYGNWRRGERWGAIFDGGFWLVLLPGLIFLATPTFVPGAPEWLIPVGKWLAIAGAAGLILTQGRHESSLVGKAVVGVISLYGIVGTYGCVAFISDILSYSRLLALGLTTTIVGLAVNIVAGMLKDATSMALLGGVLFALVAVPGHIFNLLISGLGAFIHSARLIFVEFFSRFYEPKAERFVPLGAGAGRIRVLG